MNYQEIVSKIEEFEAGREHLLGSSIEILEEGVISLICSRTGCPRWVAEVLTASETKEPMSNPLLTLLKAYQCGFSKDVSWKNVKHKFLLTQLNKHRLKLSEPQHFKPLLVAYDTIDGYYSEGEFDCRPEIDKLNDWRMMVFGMSNIFGHENYRKYFDASIECAVIASLYAVQSLSEDCRTSWVSIGLDKLEALSTLSTIIREQKGV